MSLSSELLEDVTEAFDGELSDVVDSFTLKRFESVYSSVTGANVPTEIESEDIRGSVVAFTKREIEHSDGSFVEGDLKMLVIASEVIVLTGGIKVDDQLLAGPEGLDYRVLTAPLDPTKTLYQLHLRVYANG